MQLNYTDFWGGEVWMHFFQQIQPVYIFEVYKLETSLISEYGPSWQFSRAITSRPVPSVTAALRAVDKVAPNFKLMLQRYDEYVDALYEAGTEIIELML